MNIRYICIVVGLELSFFMKRHFFELIHCFGGWLATVAVASFFFACTDGKIEKQLSLAESLIVSDPDSTMAMLFHMDTTHMSDHQRSRQELLYLYTSAAYGSTVQLDSAYFAKFDNEFSDAFNTDGIKWSIIKSIMASQTGDPVARLELLKDAEFLAIQLNDTLDLGIAYQFLSRVYQDGFNGTVGRYYANKAADIFRKLNWPKKVREARMAVAGSYMTQRDYKTALDSLLAMKPEVMANAHDSFKVYFLDQLARSYDTEGESGKAIAIWHSLYDGKYVSSNTLAHWAHAYFHKNEIDSAYMMIQRAKVLPHNTSDEALCRNVEYDILERMGRKSEMAEIDSLRNSAANEVMKERKLEESSLALNLKYDSTARKAWIEAADARNRTNVAIFITILAIITCIFIYVFLKRRNKLLRLEHENDILRIKSMQDNLFKSDCRNKDMSIKISELFQSRFNLVDSLAATYFECRDTGQEQKRIYSDVKTALSNFGTKESVDKLTEIVNGYKENLMEHFRSDFPKISAAQYRLALYLFCGFSLPAISTFTDTDLRNIYVYKSRLKSMISKSDSPRKDEYIQYFA